MTSGDAAPPAETYTDLRRTAIHEAGHGVMAYWVRRPFTTITVLPDDDALGRVQHAPPGDWFRPDIEVDGRVRHRAEQHLMIIFAGAETEQRWACNTADAPADWEDRLEIGASHDKDAAIMLASSVCGSAKETEAFIEWQRQRVLNIVGRPGDAGATPAPGQSGNPEYWRLVYALANAVQDAGTLRWRKARAVLQASEHEWFEQRLRSHKVLGRVDRAAAPGT